MRITLTKITLLIGALLTLSAGFSQSINLDERLPFDSNYRVGRLENGLTYYIREAEKGKGRADFFIVHNVGALQEEESQRGLAHFLEHMAFNGTKHFPNKELLDYFATIGVKFGANINAYTAMDRTVYNISSVPTAQRESIIDSTLLALHDWSHYILCEEEEIEKERGVVREEWRRGDDARSRMLKGINRVIQTGSRFAERDPIGLMEVVDNFSRETLIEYYHKWYRPDLQAVIVVGDIEVDDIERKIVERFSSIPKRDGAAPRESYTIPDNREPIVGLNSDPESKALSVRMVIKIPHRESERANHTIILYDRLVNELILEMLKERYQTLTKGGESHSRAIIPSYGSVVYACSTLTVTGVPKEGESNLKVLEEITRELERALRYNFEESELEQAKESLLARVEGNYRKEKRGKSSHFVSAAVEHFTRSTPLIDIEEGYLLSKKIVEQMGVDEIEEALQRVITDHNRVAIFSVPESHLSSLPSEEEVQEMLSSLKEEPLESFKVREQKEIISPNLPVTKVLSTKIKGSTTLWKLTNGATVIWNEEPLKEGEEREIKMRAFREGGYSLPLTPLELKLLNSHLFNLRVAGLDKSELKGWCDKNRISLRATQDYRYSEFIGSFSEEKSEEFFSLLYHYLENTEVEESEVKNLRRLIGKSIEEERGEERRYRDSISAVKWSANPMESEFTREFVEQIEASFVDSLYQMSFGNPSGYTFIFSSPIASNRGRELVESYLAPIKKRGERVKSSYWKEPTLKRGEVNLRYQAPKMVNSTASVTRVYHGKSSYNSKNALLARYITYILRDRLMHSIREERSGTYYVSVNHELLKYPTPILSFTIEFNTDPQLVDELTEVVQEEIELLAKEGATDQEIEQITLYLEKFFREREQHDDWSSKRARELKGELPLTEKELLNWVSKKRVNRLAKRIFSSGERFTSIFEVIE